MDPRTGAILALANWPQTNANDPAAASPERSDREDRAVSFPTTNRARPSRSWPSRGRCSQGLITPSSGFSVPDQIQVADRVIHDDTEHGVESLTATSQILARSSIVGAVEIGENPGGRVSASTPGCTASASARRTGASACAGEESGAWRCR